MSNNDDRVKRERKSLYFDLICGSISSIIALSGIVYVLITQGISDIKMFLIGTSFWIFYLCFSIFMICLGIYLWYKEKHWDESQSRTNLKPPRIG